VRGRGLCGPRIYGCGAGATSSRAGRRSLEAWRREPPSGRLIPCQAIAAARAAFARCQFDEGACELGLWRLRAYRKEWGVWKDRPRHDDASHGADAFLTFASDEATIERAVSGSGGPVSWVVPPVRH
jgi:hypothetical protein